MKFIIHIYTYHIPAISNIYKLLACAWVNFNIFIHENFNIFYHEFHENYMNKLNP
jgi:hypothetical protein